MTITKQEDRITPRICVAPAISDCLRLAAWQDYVNEWFVYACSVDSKEADRETPKTRIPDYTELKREVWLKKPTHFKKLGQVRFFRVSLVQRRPFWGWVNSETSKLTNDVFQMTPDEFKSQVEFEQRLQDEQAKLLLDVYTKFRK